MAITEDKHVKIMFSKMQKWEQVADFELYIILEPCAEVSIEEIVQTTTSLQFVVLDDQCTTLGGYTPLFQETPCKHRIFHPYDSGPHSPMMLKL